MCAQTLEIDSTLDLKSILATAIIKTLGQLPMGTARAFGSLLGKIAYLTNTRMAMVTRYNIEACYPHLSPKELKAFSRRSLEETGKLTLETCGVWCKPRNVDEYVMTVRGEALVKKPLSEGKGLLVLAPHLGNWEVLGLYLGEIADITNMYLPPKLEGMDGLIRSSRTRAGSKLVPTNARGVAAMVKTLRAGNIAGLLPDQQPKDNAGGVFAPFFGRPALTMTLAAGLIQKTGCAVVFGFAKRVPQGFELVFQSPPKEIYNDNSEIAAQALNRGIESLIACAPEQYQWDYKRFRTTPNGEENIYHDV